MTKRDSLTPAIRKHWTSALATEGFVRMGRRNFARFHNDMLHVFNFQVSAWGSRDFCVNVSVESGASQSGGLVFRLRHAKGADLWLPSATAEQAERSAQETLAAAIEQALPVFALHETPRAHALLLRREDWAARHHQLFAIGVAEALAGELDGASLDLQNALTLYTKDIPVYPWAAKYAEKANSLLAALADGQQKALLESWVAQNLRATGLSRE